MPILTAHGTDIHPQRFKMEFKKGGECYTWDSWVSVLQLGEKLHTLIHQLITISITYVRVK
jgi:hypothetical protein